VAQASLIDVLAVRALEEADPERIRAVPEPRHEIPRDDRAALVERAGRLRAASPAVAALTVMHPWLHAARWSPLLASVALLCGVLITGIGEARRINVLDPPLVGLFFWNVGVYAALVVRRAWPRASGPLRAALLGGVKRLAARAAGARLSDDLGARLRTLSRYATLWERAAPGASRQRAAGALHLAAAAFALGAVAGLYLDGLGTAYRTYWESTFADAGAVRSLLVLILGPAAALTGLALPDAEAIAAMAGEPVPAARWIHLWAASLGLWVVAPRALMALAALRRAARVERTATLDPADAYYQRTLAALRGEGLPVRVVPYGYAPDAATIERLRQQLRARLGDQAVLAIGDPVAWDEDPRSIDSGDAEHIVVLINPAQTPEEEVHGPLLGELGGRAPITVVLDAPAYRTAPARLAHRLARWAELLERLGVERLTLEAGRTPALGVAS